MANEPQSPEIVSHLEYYKLVRGQIEHEDNLVGQRQSWFISSQSFLFTAYAIVSSNVKVSGNLWVGIHQHDVFILIPAVAIIVCVLTLFGAAGGLLAMGNLRRLHGLMTANSTLPPFPPVQGYRRTYFLGQAGPVLLPPMFMLVWIYLLWHGRGI